MVLAVAVVAGTLFWLKLSQGDRKFVSEQAPTVVRVIDPSELGAGQALREMSAAAPVIRRDGVEFLRFESQTQQLLVATGTDTTWSAYIPKDAGECGLSGSVIACSTGDGMGVAVNISDGSEAPAGDYQLEEVHNPSLLPNQVAPETPSGVEIDDQSRTEATIGDKHLIADQNAIRRVDGDSVKWSVDIAQGTAELNGFGTDHPRWVADNSTVIISTPQGVVAINIEDGSERWVIEKDIESWFVNDTELYVQSENLIEVFDLEPGKPAQTAGTSKYELAPLPVLSSLAGLTIEFSSGHGGWVTVAEFGPGGTFTGRHVGASYATAVDLPQLSEFKGRFELVERKSEFEFVLNLVELEVTNPDATFALRSNGEQGFAYSYAETTHGFTSGAEFLLFLPGADMSSIPSDAAIMLFEVPADGGDTLDRVVLVNADEGYGMSEIESELAPEDDEFTPVNLDGKWCSIASGNEPRCFVIKGRTYQDAAGQYPVAELSVKNNADENYRWPGLGYRFVDAPGGHVGIYTPAGADLPKVMSSDERRCQERAGFDIEIAKDQERISSALSCSIFVRKS